MRRLILLLLFGAGMFAMAGCNLRPPGPDRLLFVVPAELPGGESSGTRMMELEVWMSQQAGGFTRIDNVEGGWLAPDGTLMREANSLYLISLPPGTPRSFQSELEGRIIYGFEQQEAWIQKW